MVVPGSKVAITKLPQDRHDQVEGNQRSLLELGRTVDDKDVLPKIPSSCEEVPIRRSRSIGRASPVFPLGDVEHPVRKRDHGLRVTRMIEKVLGQFGDADTVSKMVLRGPRIGPVWPCRTADFDK